MNAITLPNPLPATLVCVSDHALALIASVEREAAQVVTVTTEDQHRAADALLREVQKTLKELEESRKTLKAPLLELSRQLDAAASEAATNLIAEKSRIGKLLVAYTDAENERRAAIFRAQQEAARKAAEEAAERARAEAAAHAAAKASAADAPAPWEVPTPVVPEVQQPARLELVKSSSVTKRRKDVLVIHDASLIPRDLCDPNEARILARIKSGMPVPGCSLTTENAVVGK